MPICGYGRMTVTDSEMCKYCNGTGVVMDCDPMTEEDADWSFCPVCDGDGVSPLVKNNTPQSKTFQKK